MKDNMLGRILAYATIFLVAVIIVTMVQRKKSNRATNVVFEIEALRSGDFLIKSEDILEIIERSFGHEIVGEPLGGLDMERMERVLESASFILSADAYVDAEEVVHLEIKQREPIVRIMDRDGQQYYLDHTGTKMKRSDHFTARVLVATGNIPPYDPEFQTAEDNNLRYIFELTQKILKDDFLENLVGQIHVNGQNELQMVPIVGDQRIVLGNIEELDDKIFRLKTFYQEAMSRMGWNKYKTINLKFRNQVVCKKR